MMLAMRHRKAITAEVGNRYRKAAKKDKGKVLDEFSVTTGYNRVYAVRILRLSPGKVLGYSKINGRKIKYIISRGKKIKRVRDRIYGYDIFLALKKIRAIFDFICSKPGKILNTTGQGLMAFATVLAGKKTSSQQTIGRAEDMRKIAAQIPIGQWDEKPLAICCQAILPGFFIF